jgi:4-amino-4-deoxy-L-arabinose transferase-like glycosyltransferase
MYETIHVIHAFSSFNYYFILKLFGIKALRDVYFLQAIMSAVTIFFAEVAARRLFGKVAGQVAAGIYAIYAPFLYYTALILSETTFFFFTLAAIAMLARYMDTGKKRDLIFPGILFGL